MVQKAKFTLPLLFSLAIASLSVTRSVFAQPGPELCPDHWTPESGSRSGEAPTAPAASCVLSPAARAILDELNRCRRIAGVPAVTADATLSAACLQHVHYLALNADRPGVAGLGAHTEDPQLPGFSETGRAAAEASVIAVRERPETAVQAFFATLFHRIPLLRPNLRRVGIACEGGITVINSISGLTGEEGRSVAYPAAEQTGVPVAMSAEIPSPTGRRTGARVGYPITLQFPTFGPEVTVLNASLTDAAGEPVPFTLSSPERPATQFPQQNTVALIPFTPLAPGARYRVDLEVRCAGKEIAQEWVFETGK